MDGKVLISRQSFHFFFVDKIIEVFFPIFTLIGRVTNYFSRQEKGINCKNKGTNNNN